MMSNPLATYINAIDTRLKRLEAQIGSIDDLVMQFMSLREEVGVSDHLNIYKRDINTSFIIGYSRIGTDRIGDRRSAKVLIYSGDGT